MPKKLKIIKEDTELTQTQTDEYYDTDTSTESDTESETESESETTKKKKSPPRFESLSKLKKKYNKKSIQDQLTKDEIKEKIAGTKRLDSSRSKRYLLTLPLFKVWIKYYNMKIKKFRVGGLLIKVDPELRFITLLNPSNKITWSVQVEDCIFFIPDPKISLEKERIERELKEKEEKELQEHEELKNKLYKLYIKRKLKLV